MNDCRGFLSSQWKCGTCDTKICNNCNELKETPDTHGIEHLCKPENVASMELLNKDTKPCPECATMIYRISGCPQMFCTNCNTPWDWGTGRKITGVIHNPHYYDFVRNGREGTGRNHGDIPCGGLPDVYTFNSMFRSVAISQDHQSVIYNTHNVVAHINHHELRENNIDILSYFHVRDAC
jgi:hypothetical protein